jgi:hypothetical protein
MEPLEVLANAGGAVIALLALTFSWPNFRAVLKGAVRNPLAVSEVELSHPAESASTGGRRVERGTRSAVAQGDGEATYSEVVVPSGSQSTIFNGPVEANAVNFGLEFSDNPDENTGATAGSGRPRPADFELRTSQLARINPRLALIYARAVLSPQPETQRQLFQALKNLSGSNRIRASVIADLAGVIIIRAREDDQVVESFLAELARSRPGPEDQ